MSQYTGQTVNDGLHGVPMAASQSSTALANPRNPTATGAAGDYLAGILLVPASLSPGTVTIQDGDGATITVFAGGASSLVSLVPFFIPLGFLSFRGPWKVATGANLSIVARGLFS